MNTKTFRKITEMVQLKNLACEINFSFQETTITPWCGSYSKMKIKTSKASNCGFIKLHWKNVNMYQINWNFIKYLVFLLQKHGKERILWCEIDRYSRTIFPIFFLIFMLFYWPLLIFKSTVIF